MEQPEFRLSSLIALAVAAIVIGGLGGIVVGGLADNTPAGWSFFALTLSHVMAGGVVIILTHDVKN